MRTLRLAAPLLGLVAAIAAHGCAFDPAGLPPGATSSVSASGTGGSVSSSASSTSGCLMMPESCDDGVDNDCDGLVDCADDECTGPAEGRACVADAPAGWTLTTLAPEAIGCPAGYDTPVPIAPAPTSASAMCDCNCGAPVSNPCTQGKLTVTIGNSCSAIPITSNVTGKCDPLATPITGQYQSCLGYVLPAAKVACEVTLNKPAAVPPSVDTLCAPAASKANGCGAGQSCLPKVASAKLCIQAKGDRVCPSGPFNVRSVVGTPGDVKDLRSCDACLCTSNATSCSNAKFTAYTDAACTMDAATTTIDGACKNASQSLLGHTHFLYEATPNLTTCTPSLSKTALIGDYQLNDPLTVCCQ